MRTLLTIAFGLEALFGIQTLAGFVTVAATYDTTVWVVTLVRGLVTIGQGVTAMWLSRRSGPVRPFGRGVALASAVLLTLEIGARLAPSSLPPGTRELAMVAYWLYTGAVVWALGRIGSGT